MKRIALYIILFSYSMLILSPVTPYISDLVAHSFYLDKHMTTVHYENGKLHVHKEVIDKAQKDEPAKESSSSTKKENSTNDHMSQMTVDSWQYLPSALTCYASITSGLAYSYLSTHYPPPRA